METKEYSAKTVDEAITKACIDLGMSSDQLNIEVVNEGSTGFLGFGSKPALIRVTPKTEEEIHKASESVKSENTADTEPHPAEKAAEEEKKAPETEPVQAKDTTAPSKKPDAKTEAPKVQKKQNVSGEDSDRAHEKNGKRHNDEPVERSEEEIQILKDSAEKFLSSVFKAMDLPVNITMDYEPEDNVLAINFEGKDMGILIGKRGQTLDSLQYLTSLVVNRSGGQFVRIKLDTEDYRRRRKETLENLANNIARKVKKTGRPVSLEPMNPYERRIIHSCLQSNRYVETYSEGTEPYRYVVISPVR